MRVKIMIAAVAVATMLSGTAQAQNVTAENPRGMLNAITAAGYTAKEFTSLDA